MNLALTTFAALCASMVASSCISAREAPAITLGALKLYLFYKESGSLSDDLLARSEPFVAWNTIIGGGAAEEPADDMLLVIPLVLKSRNLHRRSFGSLGDRSGRRGIFAADI